MNSVSPDHDDILVRWVPYVIGARTSIVVALDWTDFESVRISS